MKQTTLRKLKFDTGLTTKELAQKVGVKERTLKAQLSEEETTDNTIRYMRKLGIKEVTGIENGVNITINLK